MLVIGVALARMLFGRRDRMWAALVMPALAVAVALTFTRNSAVGACAGGSAAVVAQGLPAAGGPAGRGGACSSRCAPAALARRFISTFDLKDPTNRDRLAMLREGEHMIRAHPIVGVGPNMVRSCYGEIRVPDAGRRRPTRTCTTCRCRSPPNAAAGAGRLAVVRRRTDRRARQHASRPDQRFLAAAALAAVASMLAAGMFEYNFGDSEFLMLFLSVITLPCAAARSATA